MFKLKNVSKIYKTKQGIIKALDSVNLEFKNNGFYLIYGQSGCGKSTLLNLLAQFENKSEGELEIKCKTKEIGVVFQNSNLLEGLTVRENLSIFGFSEEEIENALTQVGLFEKLNEKVKVLSGGEKQRLSIARAILKKIYVLLLDEPTGNLDEKNSIEIFEILKTLSKQMLVVVVSHNYDLARKYVDVEIHLVQGKINDIKENKVVEDKELLPLEQSATALSLIWQVKYGFKILISKLGINIVAFVLIALTLLIFMTLMSVATFDLKDNLYNEVKGESALLIAKNEYNPYLQKNRLIYKGQNIKNELNEFSSFVLPYVSSNQVSHMMPSSVKPSIIIIPDDFALPNLQGDTGIVITDLLKEYYFSGTDGIGEEIDLTIKTSLTEIHLKQEITGVVSTDFTQEQFYFYKNSQDFEFETKYGCIYITESIMKNVMIGDSIRLGGSKFNKCSMKTYVEEENIFKIYEEEELLLGHSIQDKYEIIVTEFCYNLLFPYETEFEEHEVFFRDISESPNAAFYAETLNLYSLTNSLKIVGVVKDTPNFNYIISQEFMNEIMDAAYDFQFTGYMILPSEENLKDWIRNSLNHNLIIANASAVYQFNYQRKNITSQCLYLFGIVGIIAILFVIYSGYNQIKYREKEIIIFKAFRVSRWRILSPFLMGELIKVLCSFIVVTPFVSSVVTQLNKIFISQASGFQPQLVSPLVYVYTLLICIVLTCFGILLPFLNINRKEIGIAFKDC